MRLAFLDLPSTERNLYLEQAALQRNISPVVLEKDFWVCWLLGILFDSRFAECLVFKGGTSLSKVFGAIDRFSEDIDLSVSPAFLNLPEAGASRNQAHKWMTKAESVCGFAVEQQFLPFLNSSAETCWGKGDHQWFEFEIDDNTNSPVLLFHYPTTLPTGFDYVRRSVKLEFGALTDQQPVGRHLIVPWIAEAFPDAFADWRCSVVSLGVERTFWEKATILHAEYHRPVDRPTPDRFSRHYADTAALAVHPCSVNAIQLSDVRDQVVKWKQRFFGSAWAHYETATPGTFHLVPPAPRLPALRRDYAAMREMYLTEPPSFDEVIATLADLESRINGSGS